MASLSPKLASTTAAELTSFVGRRNDLTSVRQLFSVTRLVTLTGIGGVGKTRLALQVAGEMRRAFPDGVHLVELASLTDPDLVPQAVIDALDLPEQRVADPMSALSDFLRERRLLLILDNCEHLVDATADLLDQVLRGAPDVSVLVTSRQALRIGGEHIYPVPPLLVPDPEDTLAPGSAGRYPSVALFADRSAAVVPGFAVTPDNEAAVVRLCHRLEGIPLALELAAVRLRVLTVDELASRLDDRFQVLREGNRNLPRRHRTLQSLIDWSHDLCTEAERLLWARASVFAGGFGADSAEAVCADQALPAADVLDTIAGLVDKSILVREEHGRNVRFRMLETLREYGRARLTESGEQPAVARRHRDWFAHLIATASQEWAGPRQEDWATRLRLDHPDIRAALEYCVSEPGEARVGLGMSGELWFWGAMDHMSEASIWLDRLLALDHEPSRERAWALTMRGFNCIFVGGDPAVLDRCAREAIEIATAIDDAAAIAFAHHLAAYRRSVGSPDDLATAVSLFLEALAEYAAAGVPTQYADGLRVELAATYIALQDIDAADALVDEMYARCSAAGESWNHSYALWLRGMLALIRHDLDAAERDLAEALRIKGPFRDTLGLALTLEVASWTAAAQGDGARAAVLLGGTDVVWRSLGSRMLRGRRTRYEAQARAEVGDGLFDDAYRRGSALTVDETVAFALRHETPEAAPAPVDSPLTPREREVADLVAEGMSNKEIAAKLVISLRTAEGHVEKILSKLGFKTRAQIATWIAAQHAGSPHA
ncbi:LuxR family transcriptional regulator [Nocardioides aromaticivorans]|uniref:LuxR family transcriptional regulator n=1 Tax=Nocardioides aromaticivorans TaxID=200618 RepID=A0ABX7PGL1_9ACTN|nr:LuxR C-terminal-related transcriptional regulator [Nocardioides aromaticivorans]QSR24857.1 LuxR family transcriptional regulator [Nocardioides aromaticivorans]